jgi:surfeit locus 1 family protein
MKTRNKVFIVVVLLLGLLCIRLGFWQVSRRQERITENTRIESLLSQPLIDFPEEISSPDALEFQEVTIEGQFDFDHEILLRNRSYNDQPGVHVITPLIQSDGSGAVLIDRGWVPHSLANVEQLKEFAVTGPITLNGIIRLSMPEPSLSFLADPTRIPGDPPIFEWRVINIEQMQKQIPYEIQPIYIELTEPPTASQIYPVPDAEIDLSEGPHLSYAIQWFAFAGIAFTGTVLIWRKKSSPRG